MKKTLIVLTAASILSVGSIMAPADATPKAYANTVVYTTGLSPWTSSPEIVTLQANLKELGYFTYHTNTGYYGSITMQSVSAFQRDYGLTATGVADVATRTAIDRARVMRKLAADTYTYLRTPYVWGGSTPTPGFDCSGFVHYMFAKFGVPSVRTTSAQLFTQGTFITRPQLQPGDLVFFSISSPTGAADHVGFYLGNNQFMSATRSAGIFVQSLESSYWGPKYIGAKRLY